MTNRMAMPCLAAACLVLLAGCAGMNRPRTPEPVRSSNTPAAYSMDQYKKDLDEYSAKVKAPDFAGARILRDQMIDRILLNIDLNYRAFEEKFSLNRAGFNTGADVLELSMATAATISNGERVKTVLNAALTAVMGTRLSYDKNFLREKTTEIIISQMRANRDIITKRIYEQMANYPVQQYPMERAWRDLIELFYAGTVQAGFATLSDETGQKAADAQDRLQNAIELRLISEGELSQISQVRKKFNELFQAGDVTAAREALTELNVVVAVTADQKAVFEALNAEIRKAITDKTQLAKLMKALKIQ